MDPTVVLDMIAKTRVYGRNSISTIPLAAQHFTGIALQQSNSTKVGVPGRFHKTKFPIVQTLSPTSFMLMLHFGNISSYV
jgi:hypothetical protein